MRVGVGEFRGRGGGGILEKKKYKRHKMPSQNRIGQWESIQIRRGKVRGGRVGIREKK